MEMENKKIKSILNNVFFAETNYKLSKFEAEEIIKSILTKSKNEIIELAKNDALPFWVSMIVKKAAKDHEKGSIELIEILFDRVYNPKYNENTSSAPAKKSSLDGFRSKMEIVKAG